MEHEKAKEEAIDAKKNERLDKFDPETGNKVDYDKERMEYESAKGKDLINRFRDELVTIFHKSQDTFEKQLSFVTAGALALSVGFIKDIVQPFGKSSYKGLLGWGWGLLVLTLLLNCISHLLAARYSNKAIAEINEDRYDPEAINKRNKIIIRINWVTVGTMILGIGLIIAFITYNTLRK